ncbi:MAG: leucyl aminopeptidase [Planctomycetota bacterium]|jgi:leucyl aminopeptidase
MRISFQSSDRALTKTDLVVVLGLEKKGGAELPAGIEVPKIARDSFSGEFRESRLTDATKGVALRVLQIGVGKKADVTPERLRRAAAIAVKKAEKIHAVKATFWIDATVLEACGDVTGGAQALAEGATLGSYSCTQFKSDRKAAAPKFQALTMCGPGKGFSKAAKIGVAIATGTNCARDLQNAPGNLMRPRDMVSTAKSIARKSDRLSCTALTEAQMTKLGMGSLLSVSRGSSEPAFLIHMVYKPTGKSKGKLAFVGKGLTFDAGGISLKPSAKMDEMKYDMSGGAAVIGLFQALSGVDVPYEVHGFVPTSENLPDGMANKPGDIVTAYNGTTIEILNTDAEGRLILNDALSYAEKKVKPDLIVDLATLTGAVVVALGHELSGVISENDALAKDLVAAGDSSGELVWRLPLLEVHKKHVKGTFGDLRNINGGQGAGCTAGAAFLSHFVEKTPWAHLDIAGTAWGTEDRDYQGGNMGSGVGVRLLMEFMQQRAAK